MARTLCIANQKGGVGKTTTALNLAAGLAAGGNRVLVVDLDPQCNATTGLSQVPLPRHPLVDSEPLRDKICQTEFEGLSLLPGSHSFRDVDQLANSESTEASALAEHLTNNIQIYDYVLIDCPPSLGALTRTALAASDEVLMPIQCEYFAMEGLTMMIETIRSVMQKENRQLQFGGILLTMYDPDLDLTKEVDEEVRNFFGDIVFDTVIPRDVAVAEAPGHGLPLMEYAPRSRGTRAYTELCMEIMEYEQEATIG